MRTLSIPAVAHLTDVDCFPRGRIELRPSRSVHSWEGVGLSVTFNDEEIIEAWSEIASLGDRYVVLQRADGKPGRFAVWTRTLERQGCAWAVSAGWLRAASKWRLWWTDEEDGERRFTDFPTEAAAQDEMGDMSYLDLDARIEPVEGFDARPALATRLQLHFPTAIAKIVARDSVLAVIEATNLYVGEMYPSHDGIWWNERLDAARLSAPRGVILPHALDRWRVQ